MASESPHGTDDPREIVDELETRARAEASPDDAPAGSEDAAEDGAEDASDDGSADDARDDSRKKESPDLAEGGDQDDVAPKVPGSPEPPD